MTFPKNPAWAELIQLIPIVTLALPFIISGQVDVSQAGYGFLIAAPLSVPISALVVWKRRLLNPILVGTALWLWSGALAFGFQLDFVIAWLARTQAWGLFLAALGVGMVYTFTSRHGYIACRSGDASWIRRTSLGLWALTLACVVWGYWFRDDVRLGGGLPFIVLNVVRRVLTRRAPA